MDHSFNVAIAKLYGMEEAVIINHLFFWIDTNHANGTNFFDGRTWTFNSARAFGLLLPYMSERKIARVLENLVKNDIIVKGNYNEVKYDRTLWYAFTDNGISICQKCGMYLSKMTNEFTKNVEPIPDINTDINTDKEKEIDKSIPKKTASLYEIALTEHGVEKDAIKQLLSTLKQKRKDKNNQRALNKLLENIKESGYSVKQAIEIMNEHDWATFEVSYLKSVSAPPVQKQAPKRIHPNYPDWEYCDQSTFKNQIENDVWITGDKKVINGSRTLPEHAYPVPLNYTKWDCQAEEWMCIGLPMYRSTAEEQLAKLNKNIRAEKIRIQREQEERERTAFKPSF